LRYFELELPAASAADVIERACRGEIAVVTEGDGAVVRNPSANAILLRSTEP
jgi:hypothetical protein